jgi:hypothetical protein
MYDVSTLYVIREKIYLQVYWINLTRQDRALACAPHFADLTMTVKLIDLQNNIQIKGTCLEFSNRFYPSPQGKNGIPHFPRIHTMLAGFLGLAK